MSKKPKNLKNLYLVIGAVVGILILGCAGSSIATPTARTVAEETKPITNTDTPLPPKPTNTKAPTDTHAPTSTPNPTNTPIPTETLTQLPEPLIFNGKNNDVVELTDKWPGRGIVHVAAPKSRSNLAIWGYDTNGEKTDLLVNVIGAYEGWVPLDWDDEETVRLQVEAEGPWTIEIYPFAMDYLTHQIEVPGKYEGQGDDIVLIVGTPDLMTAKYPGDSNFAIWGYSENDRDLIVNEIGPYEGKSIIPNGIYILVVEAEGKWEIEVTAK